MKKLLMVLTSASLMMLAACSDTGEVKDNSKKAKEEEVVKDSGNDVVAPQEDTEEGGSEILTKTGQTKSLKGIGDVTFLKEVYPTDTITMGPLNVKVEAVKLFKVDNIDPTFKDAVELYGNDMELGNSAYYMTVAYSAENTSEGDLDWMDLTSLVLSSGQQIDGISNDFLPDESATNDGDSTFYGPVKKEYVDAYIVTSEDINDVKLIFNEVNDNDTFDTLAEETQVTYTLQ